MTDPGPPTAADPLARLRRGRGPGVAGIWDRIGPLTGRDRINADFYDGPGWARFRPWERLFLTFQGGARRARWQILRHLDGLPAGARVLEVGIGDGENLRFLPPSWTVCGVDLARTQLAACGDSHPATRGRLAWATAGALPFDDSAFDACYSIGGFTYFGDHARALGEMARVVRPDGLLVVADELPQIYRYGIGRVVGWPPLIRAWMDFLRVDPAFTSMVLDDPVDPEGAIRAAWPAATRHGIWSRLGYCYAAVRPDRPPSPASLPEET